MKMAERRMNDVQMANWIFLPLMHCIAASFVYLYSIMKKRCIYIVLFAFRRGKIFWTNAIKTNWENKRFNPADDDWMENADKWMATNGCSSANARACVWFKVFLLCYLIYSWNDVRFLPLIPTPTPDQCELLLRCEFESEQIEMQMRRIFTFEWHQFDPMKYSLQFAIAWHVLRPLIFPFNSPKFMCTR